MTEDRRIDMHKSWEDWLMIGLGAFAAISPWVTGQTVDGNAMLTALVVGIVVVLAGVLEMVRLHRAEEIVQFACGLILFFTPFAFGFAGTGAFAAALNILGAAITLLAIYELWQDWGMTDRDMAHHGH